MFCTLEDAWGEKKFNDKEIFQQSDKPESFKSIEHFGNTKNNNEEIDNIKKLPKEKMYNQFIELKEMFENNSNNNNNHNHHNNHNHNKHSEVCMALDNHLAKCYRCRSKYLNYYNEQKYNNNYEFDLSSFILNLKSNKDIITIFLFGLLIILLLQLFSSK